MVTPRAACSGAVANRSSRNASRSRGGGGSGATTDEVASWTAPASRSSLSKARVSRSTRSNGAPVTAPISAAIAEAEVTPSTQSHTKAADGLSRWKYPVGSCSSNASGSASTVAIPGARRATKRPSRSSAEGSMAVSPASVTDGRSAAVAADDEVETAGVSRLQTGGHRPRDRRAADRHEVVVREQVAGGGRVAGLGPFAHAVVAGTTGKAGVGAGGAPDERRTDDLERGSASRAGEGARLRHRHRDLVARRQVDLERVRERDPEGGEVDVLLLVRGDAVGITVGKARADVVGEDRVVVGLGRVRVAGVDGLDAELEALGAARSGGRRREAVEDDRGRPSHGARGGSALDQRASTDACSRLGRVLSELVAHVSRPAGYCLPDHGA